MVTCNLVGRTGNQLFQVATTIATAKRHGLPYHIPAHTLNNKEWPPAFTTLTNPDYNESLPMVSIRETQHSYQEIHIPKEHYDKNVVLNGYFQSYKYFDDYREEILELFEFESLWVFSETITEMFALVHIRIGDYKLYPTKHPIVTKDYLSRAIKTVRGNGAERFDLFSDTMNEAMPLLISAGVKEATCYPFKFHPTDMETIQFMSKYKNIIISNSSFSWWAAYASNHPDKFIVTPDESNWFGPENSHLDVKDLIPPEWHRIKY